MSQIAFYVGSVISDIVASSSAFSGTPRTLVLTPRPREAMLARYGQGGGGSFELEAGDSDFDVDLGGVSTVTLAPGAYASGAALAAELDSKLKTVDSGFSAEYDDVGGQFSARHSSSSFVIPFNTGPSSGSDAYAEMGFTQTADTTSSSSHAAAEQRFHTRSWLVFRRDSLASADAPDLLSLLLDGGPAGDGTPGRPLSWGAVDFSDVKLYGNASLVTPVTRAAWEADGNTVEYDVTDRASLGVNFWQVARLDQYSGGAPALAFPRYGLLSWKHRDTNPHHGIGIARFMQRLTSATGRHVRQLAGQELVDPTVPLGPQGMYPAPRARYWSLPLGFEQWPVDEVRDVLLKIVETAGHFGAVGVIVNDEDWRDGVVDLDDECRRGLALFGALQEHSGLDYVGARSAFIDATMRFAQLR